MAAHRDRVLKELRKSGVTTYGLLKLEARALHNIIREDEHIRAAVYGRYTGGSAMLLATDHRIIFFDKKLLFSKADEVRYEMVSGIENDTQSLFSAINLHTRIKDYKLRFVNPACAAKFVGYIEQRRIEQLEQNGSMIPRNDLSQPDRLAINGSEVKHPTQEDNDIYKLPDEAFNFLRNHQLAVLSTVDRNNQVDGATVYYTLDKQGLVYVTTKSDTHKAHNMLGDKRVALTVYDESLLTTVQIQGNAFIEANQTMKRAVFERIMSPKTYKSGNRLPPVADLDKGAFIIFRIEPTNARYTDFSVTRTK